MASSTPSSAAPHSSTIEASQGGQATTRASSPADARSKRIASAQSHDESLHRSVFRGSGGSDNFAQTRNRDSQTVTAQPDVHRRPSTATGFRSSSYKLFPALRNSYSPQASPASLQRETLKNAVAELGLKRRSSSLEPRRRRTRSSSASNLHRAAVSSTAAAAAHVASAGTAATAQGSTPTADALDAPPRQDQVTVVAYSDSLAPQLSLPSIATHESHFNLITTFDAAGGHGQPQNSLRTSQTGDASTPAGMLSVTPMSTVLEAGDSPTVSNTANTSYIRPFLPSSGGGPVSRPLAPSQSHSTSSSTVSAITAACESAAHGRPRTAPYESAVSSPVSPLFPREQQAFVEAVKNPPKPQYVWSSRLAAASQQTLHGLGLSMPLGAPPDSPLTPRTTHPPKMHAENPPPPPPKSPRWHGQWGRLHHSRESSDNSMSKISLKSDGTVLDAEFISPAKPTLFDLQMMPGYKPSVAENNVSHKPSVTIITRSPAPEIGAVSSTTPSGKPKPNRKPLPGATYSSSDGHGDVHLTSMQRDEPQPTKRKHKPAPLQIHAKDTKVEPEVLTTAIYTPSSNIPGKDDASKSEWSALPTIIKPFAANATPHSPGFPISPSHALSGNPVGRPSVLQSRGNSALSNITTASRTRSPTPEHSTSAANLVQAKDQGRSTKVNNAGEPSSTLLRLREEARLKAEAASPTFIVEAGDYLQAVDRESRRPSARPVQPRGRSIEPAMKSPTIKAAVDATDSLRDLANSLESHSTNANLKAGVRTATPDVWAEASVDNGPDPMDTLTTLGKQSEALHQRYSSLRSQRQKYTSDLSAALNNPNPGPDFHKILMDCHISLNTVNSSMDICFAKLQSLDCRKEEAIHSLKLQTAAKLRMAEEQLRKAEPVSSIRSHVVKQSEAAIRTRASRDSFQQPDSALTAIARASADSLRHYDSPVESRPRTSEGSRTDSPMRTSDPPKSTISYESLENKITNARTSDPPVQKPDHFPSVRVDFDNPRVIRNVPDKAANMPSPVPKSSMEDASPGVTTGKRFVPRSRRRQLDIKVVGGPITDLPAAPGPAPASPLPEIPTFKDSASRKPVQTANGKTTPSSSWIKSSALSQCMTNEQESSMMDRERPGRRRNSPRGTSDSSAPDEPPEARTPPENKVLMGGKLPSLSSVQVYVDEDEVLPAFPGHPLLAREVQT